MSLATVAVMTQDRMLVHRLESNVTSPTNVIRLEDSRSLIDFLMKTQPNAVILDLRIPSRGGHLEDQLIDKLEQHVPADKVVILTTEPCPETLERRVRCSDISRFREPVDMPKLVKNLASIPGDDETKITPSSMKQPSALHQQFETRTPAMQRVLSELEIAAGHDVSILLIGETGSGKTYLARLIHEMSPRKDKAFLPVACGALPSELIESELFGHVRGAFTSAHADKEGKFLVAGEGTILLDEIDVLGIEQQVKLLRVIETGQFEAVGSNTTLHSQARIIVASNMQLEPLVERGRFRPDLYYRLNMLKFVIPPLRERRADIIPLAEKFIDQLSHRHHVPVKIIEPAFLERLLSYPWPGNVRELENVIQRSIIYCQDTVLRENHLPIHILKGQIGPASDANSKLSLQFSPTGIETSSELVAQVASTEQDVIEQALLDNNNSRTATARQLGISRVTLYNKMKKYGLGHYKAAAN